jgi:fatty acid desaturase
MTDPDQSNHKPAPGFWKSRTRVALIVFVAVAALLLGFEHRVHIFAGNGLITALFLGCIVMHFFMHGGHGGGHGGDKS